MSIRKEAIKQIAGIVKGKKITLGVPAIIKNSKGEILLGKRSKNSPLYPSYWGLPGGIVDFGESLENAVKREVREELGVPIKILRLGRPYMQFSKKECPIQSLNIPAHCKITKGIPKAKDETEDVKWFSKKEIKKMRLAYSHKEILTQEGLI